MKQFLQKLRCIDGTALKLIAMISMIADHVGDMFFPDNFWLRFFGRIAMPVFSFCIAEGYSYTHDRRKYLTRLGCFALISELPFDLAFSGHLELGHQNIMLTFFLSVLALMLYDKITGKGEKSSALRIVAGCLSVAGMGIAALLLGADYTFFAVLTVFLFYVLRKKAHGLRTAAGCCVLSALRTVGYYSGTILSLIPLLCYNGKKGKGLKWLFYIFYPAHLLLLYCISRILA